MLCRDPDRDRRRMDGDAVSAEIKIRIVTQIKRRLTIQLTDQDILRLLREQGAAIPPEARITVMVPGGGDWSNTALDISKETPIEIEWSEHEHQEHDS